jgi:hypothetical protein
MRELDKKVTVLDCPSSLSDSKGQEFKVVIKKWFQL